MLKNIIITFLTLAIIIVGIATYSIDKKYKNVIFEINGKMLDYLNYASNSDQEAIVIDLITSIQQDLRKYTFSIGLGSGEVVIDSLTKKSKIRVYIEKKTLIHEIEWHPKDIKNVTRLRRE